MTIDELILKPESDLTQEDIKILVEHYSTLSAKYTAYEQAVKVMLN